jgi:hypothetical protein
LNRRAGIGTISPPFIVQFLDNGVDLWLKSFEPPVCCFASSRFVRRQLFQLRAQPLYRCPWLFGRICIRIDRAGNFLSVGGLIDLFARGPDCRDQHIDRPV